MDTYAGIARLAVDTTLLSEKTCRQIRRSSAPRPSQTQGAHLRQTVQTSASWSSPSKQQAVRLPSMEIHHPSPSFWYKDPRPPASRLPSRLSRAKGRSGPSHAWTSGAAGMKMAFIGCCPAEQYSSRITYGEEKKGRKKTTTNK